MAFYALADRVTSTEGYRERTDLFGTGQNVFPCMDGMEGFIDRFGKSVIDKPTERQMELSPVPSSQG